MSGLSTTTGRRSLRIVPNLESHGIVRFVRYNDYVYMEKRIRCKLQDIGVSTSKDFIVYERLGIDTEMRRLDLSMQAYFLVPKRSTQVVHIVDVSSLSKQLGDFLVRLHGLLGDASTFFHLNTQVTRDFQDYVTADTMADIIRFKFEVESTLPTTELKELFGHHSNYHRSTAIEEVLDKYIKLSPIPKHSRFRRWLSSLQALGSAK